jgi:hypothetical protein
MGSKLGIGSFLSHTGGKSCSIGVTMSQSTPYHPALMQAVERLHYRATVGDVAAQTGWPIQQAEQSLLTLAAQASGHLQVSQAGELVYLFPRNFRQVLRHKFFRLRLQEWWQQVWKVLFYLIRISFGIVLIALIIAVLAAILVIVIGWMFKDSDQDGGGSSGDSGGSNQSGGDWLSLFWYSYWWQDLGTIFAPTSDRRPQRPRDHAQLGFLESIYSFLFGDGNPNAELENRRWQMISGVIQQHHGAIVAEQVTPFLDLSGSPSTQEDEDYMLPVLIRFNGQPEVSPDGQLIYHFPDLQTTAQRREGAAIAPYLQEQEWRFSQATGSQLAWAIGLGVTLLILSMMLSGLLVSTSPAWIHLMSTLAWMYSVSYLLIPAGRYVWIQQHNQKITQRNQQRQERLKFLKSAGRTLNRKIQFAQEFAAQNVVDSENLAYTTETDLREQELRHSQQDCIRWERELNQHQTD